MSSRNARSNTALLDTPASDATVETPADTLVSETPATVETPAGDEYDTMLTRIETPATVETPAIKTLKTSQIKREISLRMIELFAENFDALTTFAGDDDATERASAFVANYMSYAPAIAQHVTHDTSFDVLVSVVAKLREQSAQK